MATKEYIAIKKFSINYEVLDELFDYSITDNRLEINIKKCSTKTKKVIKLVFENIGSMYFVCERITYFDAKQPSEIGCLYKNLRFNKYIVCLYEGNFEIECENPPQIIIQDEIKK